MARQDRCVICDYSELDGSSMAGLNPGTNGKVRPRDGEMRCDRCTGEVSHTLFELENEEDDSV